MNFPPTTTLLPCRQPVLEALLDVLRRGDRQGALVLGETGMGKSSLLRAVERSLPAHKPCLMVRASRALHAVPYGALGSLLDGVPVADLAGPVAALRAARQRLRGTDGTTGAVLVDDAQFLDEESAYVLTQLAVTGVIRLVAAADYSLAPSSGLHGFAGEGYLDRVHLEPLTDATLRAVAEHSQGSTRGGSVPLGTRALGRLRDATGGNPMLLRALLGHVAATTGITARTTGTAQPGEDEDWDLDPARYPTAGALTDLVASLLAPMPEEQRTVMDLLALGGAVPAADVERLIGSDAVRALVDQRFVVTDAGDARYLTLRHGLYGDVLRATLPLGRRALLHARLCEPPSTVPPDRCRRLRHLEWALDAGAPVEASALLDAARVATGLGRLEAAERFLHAVAPGHGLATAVGRARLLIARGCPADAVQVLTRQGAGPDAGATGRARNGADDDADLARIAVVLQGTALRLAGAPASGIGALLDDLPGRDAAPGAAEAGADLLRAQLLLDAGRPADVLHHLPAAPGGPAPPTTYPPASRAVALALRGGALGLLGRAVEAERCTQAALDAVLADPYGLAHVYEDVLTHHVLVLAHAGASGRALAALEQAETSVLPFGPGEVLRGIVLVRRGEVRAGLQVLDPALARLRRVDRQLLLPYAVGAASWGAAVLGDADRTGPLVWEHRALPPRGRLDLGILGRAFAAAAESLEPRTPQQPPLLDALLADVRSPGLATCEKDLLVLAVLLDVTGATDRLARAAAALQGEEALVLALFAQAAGAGDGAALGEVADRAAAVGLPLVALNAAARAWELRGESGATPDDRSLARRLGRYGVPFVGTRFEAPGGAGRRTDLTRSEAAVARRVAGGESNRDIAEALCVSVRTVEGHLHRMYVKLGLSGRPDLVRELQGLGPDRLQPAT
ncbi:LuxR C-terminal-related transcriptional regulator [Arthrobacter sp. TMS2-4]